MKKFMFYLMVAETIIASVVLGMVLAMGDTSLPTLVLALRGVMIVGAVVLIIKKYVSWVRRGELTAFYLLDAAVAVFNLVFLSVFQPTNVSSFELIITGTLIAPFLNVVLVLLLHHSGGQYATIGTVGEAAEETVPSQLHTQAIKQI
ncbi:MAG: hypothetical protein HFG26_02425 [Provencibacterium sp.]|nr:hypothetical protein [Provencibacterium sp.]